MLSRGGGRARSCLEESGAEARMFSCRVGELGKSVMAFWRLGVFFPFESRGEMKWSSIVQAPNMDSMCRRLVP